MYGLARCLKWSGSGDADSMKNRQSRSKMNRFPVPVSRSNRRRWHITKAVALGDIIAFVSALGAVGLAYANLNSRISVIENTAVYVQQTIASQEVDQKEWRKELFKRLERIEDKLDHSGKERK
jgi:hypothetical protein